MPACPAVLLRRASGLRWLARLRIVTGPPRVGREAAEPAPPQLRRQRQLRALRFALGRRVAPPPLLGHEFRGQRTIGLESSSGRLRLVARRFAGKRTSRGPRAPARPESPLVRWHGRAAGVGASTRPRGRLGAARPGVGASRPRLGCLARRPCAAGCPRSGIRGAASRWRLRPCGWGCWWREPNPEPVETHNMRAALFSPGLLSKTGLPSTCECLGGLV